LRTANFIATGVPDTPRAMAAGEVAGRWAAVSGVIAEAAVKDADAALDRALEFAGLEGGPLVIAGSLYLVGHLRGRLVPEALERDRA